MEKIELIARLKAKIKSSKPAHAQAASNVPTSVDVIVTPVSPVKDPYKFMGPLEMAVVQENLGAMDLDSLGDSLRSIGDFQKAMRHRTLNDKRKAEIVSGVRKHRQYTELGLQMVQKAEFVRYLNYIRLASVLSVKAYQPSNLALLSGKELFDVLESVERIIDRSRGFLKDSMDLSESAAALLEELDDDEVKEVASTISYLKKIPPERREMLRRMISSVIEARQIPEDTSHATD